MRTSPFYFVIIRRNEEFKVIPTARKLALEQKKGGGGGGGRREAGCAGRPSLFYSSCSFRLLECYCNAIKFGGISSFSVYFRWHSGEESSDECLVFVKVFVIWLILHLTFF